MWILAGMIMAAGIQAASLPAAAQSGEGLCRLLKVGEVKKALGAGTWQIARDGDVSDQCYMHNGLMDTKSRAFSMRLLASNEENQAEFRDDLLSSGGTELTVAGLPAVLDDYDAVTVFFPDPWDILQLSPVGYRDAGKDVSKGMEQLAELAAARYAAETTQSAPASPSVVPDGGGAPAEACELLTEDEVSAALGGESMSRLAADAQECHYQGDQGSIMSVVIRLPDTSDTSMIERRRSVAPEASDTQIAGFPALVEVDADQASASVLVYPRSDVELAFVLSAHPGTAPDVVLGAVAALAEIGTARAVQAGLPVVPTPAPSIATANGDGLCAIITLEELTAALGDGTVTVALGETDGCAWSTASIPVSVALEIERGDEAASVQQGVATLPNTFEVAGMTAGQTDPMASGGQVGSILAFLPDESTAVMLTVTTPEDVDATGVARAIAELVAPRIGAYLGG
jgi:hypothetical protein